MIDMVNGSTVSVILLPENPNRKGASIYNRTNKILNIALDEECSLERFSFELVPSQFWEAPESYKGPVSFIGRMGINGTIAVTEW